MDRLVIRNEILEDQELLLQQPILIVGRGKDVSIPLEDQSVSRYHARLERMGDAWELTDLGSSNGTYVNEAPIRAPTRLTPGDELRFGQVRASFRGRPEVARVEDPAGGAASTRVGSPRGSPSRWVVAGLCLVTLAVCGLWILERQQRESERTDIAPLNAEPEHGGAPPPLESATPPEITETPPPLPPSATDADREPEPAADIPASAPPTVFTLRDGREIAGEILTEDPSQFRVRVRGSRSAITVMKDQILTRDREPYVLDAEAMYAAKLHQATSQADLLALMNWCADAKLLDQRREVARMLIEGDRHHPEANAVLGRFTYRGEVRTAEQLTALGVLSSHGDLVGTAEDAHDIRSLHHVLLGRSPLRPEFTRALAETRDQTITRLLDSTEHSQHAMSELLVRFLGHETGPTLAATFDDLAKALAAGRVTLQEAFQRIAISDAVRVRYPSPSTFVERILVVFIGEQALDDQDLLRNAERMVGGDRVPVFGERGASREDFVRIVSQQAAFYRFQVRSERRRILGSDEPEGRDLTRWAMRLASDDQALKELRRQWLAESRERPPVLKDQGSLVRGLFVDALGRVPSPEEESAWRRVVHDLGIPSGLATIAGTWFGASPLLHLDGAGNRPDPVWIDDQFRRLWGRDPTDTQRAAAQKALVTAGPRAVIAGLLQHPEYLYR